MFAGTQENYTQFIFSGLLVFTILSSAGLSGISTYSVKQNGSFYRMYISPVKRSSIVLGHILDVAVLSFVEIIILSVLGFILGVRIQSGFSGVLHMIPLLFLTIVFVAGLSYSISQSQPDENGFIAIINLFTLPLFFLSTGLVAYENVPVGFKIPVLINPFSHIINSLRNIVYNLTIDYRLYFIAIGIVGCLSALSISIAIRNLNNLKD